MFKERPRRKILTLMCFQIRRNYYIYRKEFYRLPRRIKLFALCIVALALCFYYQVFLFANYEPLRDPMFLDMPKCPACYGEDLCPSFLAGELQLTGLSAVYPVHFAFVKNAYFGSFRERDVVLKKLAHNRELQQFDDKLCHNLGIKSCLVSEAIYESHLYDYAVHRDFESAFGALSTTFNCSTSRVISRALDTLESSSKYTLNGRLQALTLLTINPEPIILRMFPPKKGWPFPALIGSCGRFIVENNVGTPLQNFIQHPFAVRAKLAFQLIKMAKRLTEGDPELGIYWTDVSFDNFAVDSNHTVYYIDLEHVVIVDKNPPEGQLTSWSVPHEAKFDDCGNDNGCVSFRVEDFCQHAQSDFNFYAVCRNLLSSYATDEKYKTNLMHDIPDEINQQHGLDSLLNDCAKPRNRLGRFRAAEELLVALATVTDST